MRLASRPLRSCVAQLARAAFFAGGFAITLVSGAPGWKTSPFNPTAIPLVVSSPYTSAWLQNGNGTALYEDWSRFWTGNPMGWAGFVHVDGTPYKTMGASNDASSCEQLSMKFTATSSVFTLRCGAVDFTYQFLSPINPDDLLRFSLPFSYMMITAAPNDGKAHSVKIYTDISAEHASTDFTTAVNWHSTKQDKILVHQIQVTNQVQYDEKKGQIRQGSMFYATFQRDGLTYRTGDSTVLRNEFVKTGKLTELLDEGFRVVSDRWPGVSFAVDLGSVQFVSDTLVFGMGHARDPIAEFVLSDGSMQERAPYYLTEFETIPDALEFFMEDYQNATRTAELVDAKVAADAAKVSENYAGLVALSMRQALGPTELTVGRKLDGSLDKDDVLLFIRGCTDGRPMNSMSTIYTIWPLVLYVNPKLGKYLLEPTLLYHASGLYKQPFVVHDIGSEYPRGLGHADDPDSVEAPIDSTAGMLILLLSYSQRTKDTSLLKTHFKQLDKWAAYLVDNALVPSNQNTTDTMAPSVPRQSNLALKGIIGIAAMGEIAKLVNEVDVSNDYSQKALSFIEEWRSHAMSKDNKHLTFQYDVDDSWGLTYNLYANRLLGLSIVPADVLATQESWYKVHSNRYGIYLDSRNDWTISAWDLWIASLGEDEDFQHHIIDSVVAYYSSGTSKLPMTDWYDTSTGKIFDDYYARPEVGGHLSFLALREARLRVSDDTVGDTPRGGNLDNAAHGLAQSLPLLRTLLLFLCGLLY